MTVTLAISRDATGLPATARGGVLALDAFESMHLGQQALAARAARMAEEQGVAAVAVVIRGEAAGPQESAQLLSLRAVGRELAGQGMESIHMPRPASGRLFTDFMRDLLVDRLAARQVLAAADGGLAGHLDELRALGQGHGFGITLVEPALTPDGVPSSAAALRTALLAGDPGRAAALLGRPWEIEGRVRRGDQRGRTIGFPTANLGLGAYLQPALGVYAVRIGLDRHGTTNWYGGAANLGRRPTVDGQALRLEAHLFDFAEDLYGRRLRVQLVAYLRGEKKFDGLPALQAQIAADCQAARTALSAPA